MLCIRKQAMMLSIPNKTAFAHSHAKIAAKLFKSYWNAMHQQASQQRLAKMSGISFMECTLDSFWLGHGDHMDIHMQIHHVRGGSGL